MRLAKRFLSVTSRAILAVGPPALLLAVMADTALASLKPRTPEIDPGSIAAAITLFAGGTMYLSSRRRAK